MKIFTARYIREQKASSGVEAALLLPVLFTMIFGVFDLGQAMTANHKMITASQVVADLVSRNSLATQDDIDQAVEAAVLAMSPYVSNSTGFGIDILSVKFDTSNNPTKLWEKTYNMGTAAYSTAASAAALTSATGLGSSGEGAMVVTIIYDYKPTFGSGIISSYRMKETAFARGRRSPIVSFQ